MDDNITDETIEFDSPEARRSMRRRHLAIALRMQAVAVAALEELEQKVAAGKPLEMTGEDAHKLLDCGARLERTALGEKEHDDGDPAIPFVPPRKPS
jgi:hypothetical protein